MSVLTGHLLTTMVGQLVCTAFRGVLDLWEAQRFAAFAQKGIFQKKVVPLTVLYVSQGSFLRVRVQLNARIVYLAHLKRLARQSLQAEIVQNVLLGMQLGGPDPLHAQFAS